MPRTGRSAALLFAALVLTSTRPAPNPPAGSVAVAHKIFGDDVQTAGTRIIYRGERLPRLALSGDRSRPVRSLLRIRGRMRFGDYVWNDAAIPSGETWVRIDLGRQTMSVFRGADEIGTAVILYGADGKPTPTGIFPVLEKAVHHRSTLYDAEMPYMLRLTGDGVAIHASNVRERAATHGCIGVPAGFARRLFGEIRRGDLVAIVGAARRA